MWNSQKQLPPLLEKFSKWKFRESSYFNKVIAYWEHGEIN